MNIHFFKRAALLTVAAGFILAVGCNQNVTTPQQQKGSTLTITLTQSPAKETKTNGAVTVASSTSIKEAKWQEGDHKTKDVFANGTVISGNSFTVDKNGTYSVAVRDNDGRREVETIKIENIDKTPPASVSGLMAGYSVGTHTITVNWQNPDDADFQEVQIVCKKGGGGSC